MAREIRDGAQDKRLSLRLLGPPEASLEGLPVRFRIKKELALLCYLAAEGVGTQEELAELLWPESESGTPVRTCALSCTSSGRP